MPACADSARHLLLRCVAYECPGSETRLQANHAISVLERYADSLRNL
jgi:hypothetical protein